MGLEELLSDRDSEDELDEDLATVEDRRVFYLMFVILLGLHDCCQSGNKID